MSGIEVAGLILGVLPIVLHAVVQLGDGIRAVRSRAYIKKLSHALDLQQLILKEVFRALLRLCEYDGFWNFDDDPVGCINDPAAWECLSQWLQPERSDIVLKTLNQTHLAVQEVAKNISGLLPSSMVCESGC